WLGAVALMSAVPIIAFMPIAGSVADRTDKMTIIRRTRTIGIILTMLLAALTMLGWINIYGLCALVFIIGANSTFTQPVRLVMIPYLVPREDLAPAISLNAGSNGSARFIGPAIAGLVIASFGTGSAFLLHTLGLFLSLVGLMNIKPEGEELSGSKRSL